jgi:heme A synthase
LVIEWTHRLIAALLLVALAALAAAAFAQRGTPGVGGRGGVLRASLLGLVMWPAQALLGAITVWLGNVWYATVGHWLLAATLLAALAAAVMRAGGLGGGSAVRERGSERAARGTLAGAAIALITILFGGLTATYPGANMSCLGFPLCRGGPGPGLTGQHIQITHRVLALLLVLHVFGLLIGVTRRREASVVVRGLWIAAGLLVAQVVVAATMVEFQLPPAVRSLHQAVGVLIWLTLFSVAYLARLASRDHAMLAAAPATDGAHRPFAPSVEVGR